MAIFRLKRGDTRPILEVALKNPDGSAHDLTGSTAWKLHIRVNGTVFTRDMIKQGLDTAGVLRYLWVDADWVAGLPAPASPHGKAELQMEYEVIGGTSRMTFPNGGHDTLIIVGDLA
jgi:hypothetical protein